MGTTLLVLAAGMGSRFGGLKQIESLGPNGETLMDYSVSYAIDSGFDQVVFVIRQEFSDAFEVQVAAKFRHRIKVSIVYQELTDLPAGFRTPAPRSKPWGTGHAVLAARRVLDGPFVMVNADDYYGPAAFRSLRVYLAERRRRNDCAMAGYRLADTLSENGSVARAICRVDKRGFLVDVTEHKHLKAAPNGSIYSENGIFSGDELVSMNCFGFQLEFLTHLQKGFEDFLETNVRSLSAEYLIPDVVGELCRSLTSDVKVLDGNGQWFGVTYPDDKANVKRQLARLTLEKGAMELAHGSKFKK